MSQSRFVVLRHDIGHGLDRTDLSHFDWMYQIDGRLRTWATQTIAGFDQAIKLDADRLPDHRVVYLEYEGNLSDDRGAVTRVLSGNFTVVDAHDDRFVAQMRWEDGTQSHSGFVVCQRIIVESDPLLADTRSAWSLSFSPGRYETN